MNDNFTSNNRISRKRKVAIFIVISIILVMLAAVIFGLHIRSMQKRQKLNVSEYNVSTYNTEIGKKAIISSSVITQTVTGVEPFDENDEPGNDSSDTNDIVRSFDQITYNIENTLQLKNGTVEEKYYGGTLEIKAELPSTCTNFVKWDLASMLWAEDATLSEDGRVFTAKYSMSEENITVPGKQTLVVVAKVLGAPNELEVKPTFEVNIYGNTASEKVLVTNVKTVKVSATPKIDIYLVNMSSNAVFISKNEEIKKVYTYGLAFRVQGDSESKGVKGIEVPTRRFKF